MTFIRCRKEDVEKERCYMSIHLYFFYFQKRFFRFSKFLCLTFFYICRINIVRFLKSAHIFFDDAFCCMYGCVGLCNHDENETQVNQYVITLVETVQKNVENLCMPSSPPTKCPTPYGGRLVWTLPGKTKLIVHLKDKNKIRHRKRWSQV